MKIAVTAAIAALVLSIASCGKVDVSGGESSGSQPAANPMDYNDADFVKLCEDLDLGKQTKLYVQERWNENRNKQVTWTGKVFDVQGGRGRAEVTIAKKEKPRYRGFNVAITVYDTSAAGKLKKGDLIKFTGSLYSYKANRGGITVFRLDNAEILENFGQK